MYEYFLNIVQISPKNCPNIIRTLSDTAKIFPKQYPDIAQILSKALSIHCPNIVQIFPKYFTNIIQSIFDFCPNMPEYMIIYYPDEVKKI